MKAYLQGQICENLSKKTKKQKIRTARPTLLWASTQPLHLLAGLLPQTRIALDDVMSPRPSPSARRTRAKKTSIRHGLTESRPSRRGARCPHPSLHAWTRMPRHCSSLYTPFKFLLGTFLLSLMFGSTTKDYLYIVFNL